MPKREPTVAEVARRWLAAIFPDDDPRTDHFLLDDVVRLLRQRDRRAVRIVRRAYKTARDARAGLPFEHLIVEAILGPRRREVQHGKVGEV